MKASEIRAQSREDNMQMLVEKQKELLELKVKKAVSESATPPVKAKAIRREIARIKTVLRERETDNV